MKQLGECAFSAACSMPGTRVRLQGTNQFFCPMHARYLDLPSGAGSTAGELGGSRSAVVTPQRHSRRGYDLGVAVKGWIG